MRLRLLALLTALALAVGLAPAATAAPADWDELGLAHADLRRIHFEGNSMHRSWRQTLSAIAVTADSAIVLLGEPNEPDNRLVELPAGSGEPREIGRYVRGIPMADVAGHRVFWSSRTGHQRARLHAYDTATGTSYERARGRAEWIVFAVDGDTAYASSILGSRIRAWTPDAGFEVVVLPDDTGLFDVSNGVQALGAEDGSTIVAANGTVLASNVRGWLTLDPSGLFASQLGRWGIGVWDVAHGRSIELAGLGGRRWFAPVWAPTGELVVTTFTNRRDERDWDDASPVAHYRCPMPAEAPVSICSRLPSRRPHATWMDPVHGVTSLDQLAALGLFA